MFAIRPVTTVIVISRRSLTKLSADVNLLELSAVPTTMLAPWIALHRDLEADSIILVHDAFSGKSPSAVGMWSYNSNVDF